MGCCGDSCSCGKGKQASVKKDVRLVQLPDNQGIIADKGRIGIPGNLWIHEEVVEIRFKNNRKEYFRNRPGLVLERDDRVVVEVDGGYNLGTVAQVGEAANKNFKEKEPDTTKSELKKVQRKATQEDLQKWLDSKRKEKEVLSGSRHIASGLGLNMAISDVEFRGDGKEVIIFYWAKERKNFRELEKRYAEAFQVRIEMRQTGIQQETAKSLNFRDSINSSVKISQHIRN